MHGESADARTPRNWHTEGHRQHGHQDGPVPEQDRQPVRVRVAAYAIATEGERGAERLLLTRLSEASTVFEPGLWHLPGGGVDPGEQPYEALERELWEETGLRLRSARLLEARGYLVPREGFTWQLVALLYAVDLAPGRLAVTEIDGSTEEVAWLPRSGLADVALSPAALDSLRLLDGSANG